MEASHQHSFVMNLVHPRIVEAAEAADDEDNGYTTLRIVTFVGSLLFGGIGVMTMLNLKSHSLGTFSAAFFILLYMAILAIIIPSVVIYRNQNMLNFVKSYWFNLLKNYYTWFIYSILGRQHSPASSGPPPSGPPPTGPPPSHPLPSGPPPSGPLPSDPPPFGPPLSCPPLYGPSTFCPQPSGPPPFSPQPSGSLTSSPTPSGPPPSTHRSFTVRPFGPPPSGPLPI
jgi:hypothetical protein